MHAYEWLLRVGRGGVGRYDQAKVRVRKSASRSFSPLIKRVRCPAGRGRGLSPGGGRREGEAAAGCACGRAPPAPDTHPLRALDHMQPPLLRSNPLYTEEEEQEVVIIVDSLDESAEGDAADAPRTPRRAPSTSSGYGSGGGSHGRVSPTLPKSEYPEPARRLSVSDKPDGSHTTSDSDSPACTLSRSLKEDIRSCLGGCRPARRLSVSDKPDGSHTTSDSDSPACTLSRSLKEDIRSCLGGCRWEKDVGDVVEAAVRGAGGITAARARLHAALLALHEPPPRVPNRGPSLPYCGPGVRPGDVTMMPKNTEMSLLAASALFTLDGARGEALSRRLARGERRRRRCRAVLAVVALLLLLAAVGAVELLMSRGQRVFGAVLR
ncbi:hypothetical protein ABMA27_006232 [Loxostege sticticalis]|uniref:Uncharacterized protein n=1 Tax=Loxostege sticticalis TaxID=481309 RepID=A0ABR3HIG2_LOXSC